MTRESRRRSATSPDGRERVLAAARTQFARLGFEATSIRRIAAELEMVTASLYHHFSTKEDILHAILRGPLRETQKNLVTIAGGEGDAEARLVASIAVRFRSWVENWEASVIISDQAVFFANKDGFEYLQEAMQTGYGILRDILLDGMDNNLFQPDLNLYVAISIINASLNTSARQFVLGHEYSIAPPEGQGIEDTVICLVGFMLRMLRDESRIGEPIPMDCIKSWINDK